MAINRALMNRQMYNMGGASLQAGAPDLRLTGDVRPTYTQERKNRMDMAFGGIAGLDGRKKYGIGSWFQENIMDPIKDNPVTSAVIGGGLLNQFGIPQSVADYLGTGTGQNFLGDLIGGVTGTPVDTVLGGRVDGQFNLGDYLKGVTGIGTSNSNQGIEDFIGNQSIYGDSSDDTSYGQTGAEGAEQQSAIQKAIAALGSNYLPEQLQNILNPNSGVNTSNLTETQRGQLELEKYKRRNLNADLMKAIAGGGAAGAYVASQPKDTIPEDTTGINFQTAQQVLDDPNQRFKPPVEATQLAANGGRIGYGNGTPDPIMPENFLNDIDKIVEEYMKSEEGRQELMDKANEGMSMPEIIDQMKQELMMNQASSQGNMQMQQPQMAAMGGRIGYTGGGGVHDFSLSDLNLLKANKYNPSEVAKWKDKGKGLLNTLRTTGYAEGGLIDLGGNEMDLRAEGGFIPIGGKEKADDVPARLSRNEFVFTADAVRNAGGGDIDEGAQVMERLMKSLEQGGQVSEESQGLDGAREMFETSQRLEKRII